MSLKIIGSVVGVTGIVGGGITVATISQSATLSSSFANGSHTKSWNCLEVSSAMGGILNRLNISQENYAAFNCSKDISKGQGDYWIGLFPKTLITSNVVGSLANSEFALTTETKIVDNHSNDEYRTIFKGDKFLKSSVTGFWKSSSSKNVFLQTITTVSIAGETSSQDKIYISFFKSDKQLSEFE